MCVFFLIRQYLYCLIKKTHTFFLNNKQFFEVSLFFLTENKGLLYKQTMNDMNLQYGWLFDLELQ